MKRFAIFILTNGRPNHQYTLEFLRKSFKGDVFLICDNEDKTLKEYQNNYGEQVIVFDKNEWVSKSDPMDNFQSKNSVLYARNAVFEIAKDMGYEYFVMVDDDVTGLSFRYEKDGKLVGKPVKNFNKVSSVILETMDNTGTDFFSFGVDKIYLGGLANNQYQKKIIDKVYCFIFCRTEQQHFYKGIMNEDEINNLLSMSVGKLAKSLTVIQIQYKPMGPENIGGNAETYKENDMYSYVRNFYPIIAFPVLKIKTNKKGFKFSCDSSSYTVKILPESLKK